MTQYAAQPQTFRQWPRWARLQREWREFGKAALAWAVSVAILVVLAAWPSDRATRLCCSAMQLQQPNGRRGGSTSS